MSVTVAAGSLFAATTTAAAAAAASASASISNCAAINLPARGVVTLPDGQRITLNAAGSFRPPCAMMSTPGIVTGNGDLSTETGGVSIEETLDGPQFSDFRDPFYASTFPQCYALAATTVVAYTLVIMLFITPRSFLDGGVLYLGRRGFTNRGSSGKSIGGRPWLQKLAALTVAISLTIATADTFRVAQAQYSWGIQNAETMQEEVLGGTQLKIIRIISDTFLWLAQAQTLIRLFPRQREKVIIKWTAFALITFDIVFESLNAFVYTNQGATRPRSFQDAVPALSYLFQLSLGVLYAAWVLYYSLMKKRYAFYHPQMRNICLVATLSTLAIIIPVVFFILDISQPDFTGWGDYVRWVGAAAASVIVWEWVERIEALEREEKKDGILGREVFDGDEMMELTPSEFPWPRRRKTKRGGKGDGEGDDNGATSASSSGRGDLWPSVTSIATRYRSRSRSRPRPGPRLRATDNPAPMPSNPQRATRFLQPPLWPRRPDPAVTPVSRTDTASADSTVYAIRYHPLTETTSRTSNHSPPPPLREQDETSSRSSSPARTQHSAADAEPHNEPPASIPGSNTAIQRWRAMSITHALKRKDRPVLDEESNIGNHSQPSDHRERHREHDDGSRWDIRSRLEDFAASQAEKIRERIRPTLETENLPVTVVPAPPRRGTALTQLIEEESRSAGNGRVLPGRIQRTDTNVSGRSMPAPLERNPSNFSTSSRPQPPLMSPPLWQPPQEEDEYDDSDGYDSETDLEPTQPSPAALGKRPERSPSSRGTGPS